MYLGEQEQWELEQADAARFLQDEAYQRWDYERLIDFMVEETLLKTDDEILADAREDGFDPAEIEREILNIEAAVTERLAALPTEQLMSELREDGIDPDAEAEQVLQVGERAIARARTEAMC